MGAVALNLWMNIMCNQKVSIALNNTHLSLFAPGAGSYVKLDRGSR